MADILPARSTSSQAGVNRTGGSPYRPVTLIVVALGLFAQMTGVNAVGNLSPQIVQG
ncbi:hypothetical protein AB0873_31495 [Micromonospora sp. NPDC047707]|uniref:hypothetical protein n=1 Tax=Micromonospora sp. NPDC047707 TaxID=3154498 RepID=UPI0034523F3D